MKAYIDRKNSELVTVGFNPELALKYMIALDLENWSWIAEADDWGNPESWEIIELENNNET
jgi:hypothetical protein